MNDEIFLELVTKRLSNEITEQENEQLILLLEKEEYYKQYEFIKAKWENVEDKQESTQFNSKKGLEKLTSKIREYEPGYNRRTKGKAKEYWYDTPFLRIAASIVLFVFMAAGALYFSGVFNDKSSAIIWNEKTTSLGQKSILTLFDGTKITLNAGSKFKYPTNFGSKTREVHLEGEAYFEVTHNPDRPFIVHSGEISTRVLGTKFNVKAFPSEKEIMVSLVEGSVKVSIAQNGDKLLVPDQQLSYNKLTDTEQIKEFDSMKTIGWKDNVLVFDNDPLEKVFKQLERTFGVKFDLEDKSYRDKKIKASFNNESFWTVVKVIKSATGLEFRTVMEKDEIITIVFYKSKSKGN